MKKMVAAAALLLVAIVAAYVAYPYATAYLLREALAAGDQAELVRLIDFPRVRAGLKRDLPALVRSKMIRESEGWFAQFGAEIAIGLSPDILARRIDSKMTPASVIGLVVAPGAKAGRERDPTAIRAELQRKLRTMGFVAPAIFEIEFGEPNDPPAKWVTLRLTIDDLTWRVTRIIPPGAPRGR